jgi:hypothetical protein
MREQIKIEDLIKGQWYIIESNSSFTYLIKFDKIDNNSIYVLNGYNYKYNDKTRDCLCQLSRVYNITKATKEEVLKYFPDEKFEDNFILPKYWYVEIPNDLENKTLLNNWKIKQKFNHDLFKYPCYTYVRFEGGAG